MVYEIWCLKARWSSWIGTGLDQRTKHDLTRSFLTPWRPAWNEFWRARQMCANLGDNELPLLMTHVPISKPVKKTMEMLVPHPPRYASQNPLANFRGLKIYRIPGNQTLPHLMYPFHTKRFAQEHQTHENSGTPYWGCTTYVHGVSLLRHVQQWWGLALSYRGLSGLILGLLVSHKAMGLGLSNGLGISKKGWWNRWNPFLLFQIFVIPKMFNGEESIISENPLGWPVPKTTTDICKHSFVRISQRDHSLQASWSIRQGCSNPTFGELSLPAGCVKRL